MQQWHFKITGKVLVPGMEDQTMNIYPENIRDLIRISDYVNDNMPQMFMHVSLDKNLFDIIAKNAKTATIYLRIQKYDKQDDTTTPVYYTYIEDEFSVFISNDINYNRELDYKESQVIGNEKKEDIYKQLNIGLVPKSCIDANKVAVNTATYKTTMMNTVAMYLQSLHLLIEPFKYNQAREQLIIPPQETLVKTIAFLNSVSVFYDTKYLFFIDEPACTYLISRSGNGIEKIDDIYKDVYFNIHQVDDSDVVNPGMMQDDTNQQFYIDINVLDTRYTINHDTAKVIDIIQEIINPNKNNIQSTLDSIVDAAKNIESIVGGLGKTVETFAKSMENIPSDLFDMKTNSNYQTNDVLSPAMSNEVDYVNKAISIVESIPETIDVSNGSSSSSDSASSSSTTILSAADKNTFITTIKNLLAFMQGNYSSTQQLNTDFGNITDASGIIVYNTQMSMNNLGCFSYVNAQDGVAATQKTISGLVTSSNDLSTTHENNIVSNKHYPSDMTANADAIYNLTYALISKLEATTAAITGTSSQLASVNTLIDSLKEVAKLMNANSVIIGDSTSSMLSSIGTYAKVPTSLSNVMENISPLSTKLTSIVTMDIKSKFKSIVTDLRNLGDTAMNAIYKIKNIGSSINVNFDIKDLPNIKKDLSSVADLTGIGKLGISQFATELNIGGCFGTGKQGIKILLTQNDNSNEIKNYKSEMENMINQLSLNKYDLDPSVFTPNKKYTIKNYHGHSEKDGIFILNKKTEIYVREDDSFTCNTMLDFSKIATKSSNSDTQGATDTTMNSSNGTSSTNSFEIINGIPIYHLTGTSEDLFNSGTKVNTNNDNGTSYILGDGTSGGSNTTVLGVESLSDTINKIIK